MDNRPNPHPNVGPSRFDVGVVCGKEWIPVAEFGFDRTAERMGRKVAVYKELLIKDPRAEGFDHDLRPQ